MFHRGMEQKHGSDSVPPQSPTPDGLDYLGVVSLELGVNPPACGHPLTEGERRRGMRTKREIDKNG